MREWLINNLINSQDTHVMLIIFLEQIKHQIWDFPVFQKSRIAEF